MHGSAEPKVSKNYMSNVRNYNYYGNAQAGNGLAREALQILWKIRKHSKAAARTKPAGVRNLARKALLVLETNRGLRPQLGRNTRLQFRLLWAFVTYAVLARFLNVVVTDSPSFLGEKSHFLKAFQWLADVEGRSSQEYSKRVSSARSLVSLRNWCWW